MPAELLLEVGTEEIPAGFVARALAELPALARERLAAARLAHGEVRAVGTPRRLALVVEGLAERQPDRSELVTGPPAKAAFDAEGRPTRAAQGFAAKQGVEPSALQVIETDKGAYVGVRKDERGQDARALLPELLAQLIRAIPFKKAMRWGDRDETFARPVCWIVALLGGEVLPVTFAGVRAGRETRGHRFLAPGPISVDSSAGWREALRRAFVIVEPDERRTMIEAELSRLGEEAGARVRPDAALLDEVIHLVEYPVGICGRFDEAYLDVPAEVIISAMRAHQRYFALERAGGALDNRFATIAGTVVRDRDVVRRGNERVLAARLADARFFFEEDRKVSLAALAPRLEGVVFQAKLGKQAQSMAEKVRRISDLARFLNGGAQVPGLGADAGHVDRAATLCKADLLTKMVGEFPDLQGVMGRAYARLEGEPPEVAEAIFEHYLPRSAGDRLPTSAVGIALALADRLDTLVACFGAGLQPTGSADPYALRRAAVGVVAILLELPPDHRVSAYVGHAAAELAAHAGALQLDAAVPAVLEFIRTRARSILAEELPADVVDAALGAGADDLADARTRARALAAFRRRPDFEPLAVAFKRVANILKAAAEAPVAVAEALLEHEAERALHQGVAALAARVDRRLAERDYGGALGDLAGLRPLVDAFFEAVFVMAEEPRVRANRLALLRAAGAQLARIADFKQLAVAAPT